MSERISRVVILGGGTAGWMTAAAMSKVLTKIDITLIESEQIGTIGVGEATIPTLQFFNSLLGIDSDQFVKQTSGSYKLGIQFENWHKRDAQYFHAFGSTGQAFWAAGFHDFWRRGLDQGISQTFTDYNIEAVAAKQGKFARSKNGLNFAYHLDSGLYAKMLREIAQRQGVVRQEGKVESVATDKDSGNIVSLTLESGQTVIGDLFVDCSGFRGLLINETLQTPFVDWSHWLPCDRAIAVQTENPASPVPYTRSIANKAGWQWRIPLQHRMGNGIVYASQYMSDDEAKDILMTSVEGKVLTEPRPIRFKTGHREKLWNKNVIAIGLSGGFIEPLESTAIHLIQQGILRLIKLFPSRGIQQWDVDEYNKSAESDFNQIKDFIVLHYHQTERDDSEFWRYCKNMDIPETLKARMELFKHTGRFIQREEELFVDSWLQVMIGQGLVPDLYHRAVDEMTDTQLDRFLKRIQADIQSKLSGLPSHEQYLQRFCSASKAGAI